MKKGFLVLAGVLCLGLPVVTASLHASAPPAADLPTPNNEHTKKADALLIRKMYAEAIVEYQKAIGPDAKDFVLQNKLGIAYQQAQDFGKARKAYERAVKLNPNYVEAVNNLGTIYYSQRNYKKAVKFYKKAVSLNPNFATAYHNMGAAYFSMEKYEEGFKSYQQAFQLDPSILERTSTGGTVVKTTGGNQAKQNYYLAKIYAASGDLEKAMIYLQKARENGFKDFDQLEKDPAFEKVIVDERYKELKNSKPVDL